MGLLGSTLHSLTAYGETRALGCTDLQEEVVDLREEVVDLREAVEDLLEEVEDLLEEVE